MADLSRNKNRQFEIKAIEIIQSEKIKDKTEQNKNKQILRGLW
jgi:hypothetical protein